MYQSLYFMDKSTGTFGDVLAAYGLAEILDEIVRQALDPGTRRRLWIQDAGPYYMVQLDRPLQVDWVESCNYFVGSAYYVTRQGTDPAPPDAEPRDVADMKQEFDNYWKTRKQLTAMSGMTEDLRRQLEDMRPPHYWEVVKLLGDGRMKALKTYNQAVGQWATLKDYFTVNLKTILRMCAKPYADLQAAEAGWELEVGYAKIKGDLHLKDRLTAVQLLNPHQGKGLNRPKANALTMGQMESFWLQEYLKAIGLWICAAPRLVRGTSDRRTYILAPRRITFATHKGVFEKFSKRLWDQTAVKMDCIAILLYADSLLEHSEDGQYDELDFEDYGPESVVAGFHVAHYKPLNPQSYTVMSIAFLQLPTWTGDIQSREQVLGLRKIIREHRAIINNIDENRSDGYNLLLHYRDFLSGGRWEDFFRFTAGYSNYIMSQLTQGRRYMPLFTTSNLRRLIMATNKPLSEIIENPGFQNVAYAIRHSTVIPQSRKARDQQTLYEVRYGLGMDMKRKSTVRDDFVTELADFMQSYNQENNRVLERSKQQMRRDIRTSDVQEVVKLIDEYGAEVVANLLVAYGYAREERESPDSIAEANTQE